MRTKLTVLFALLLVCSAALAQSDFVRGDKVIFEDNLTNETVGNRPTKWKTGAGGKAEITEVKGEKAIWFPVNGTSIEPALKTPNNYLPDNFTIECEFTGSQNEYGEYSFQLNHPGGGEFFRVVLKFQDNELYALWHSVKSHNSSVAVNLSRVGWNHLALSYNNGDLQVFVNGRRILNVSGVQPSKIFVASATYYKEAPKNLLLRNFRICSITSTMPETTNAKPAFVPGSEIIFEDKFANEKVGAAPSKWTMLMGKSQIAQLNGENVLSFPETDFPASFSPVMNTPLNYLSDNYTVELDFYAPRNKTGMWSLSMGEVNREDRGIIGLQWMMGSSNASRTPVSIGWKTNFGEELNSSATFDLSREGWHRLAVSYHQSVLNIYMDGIHVFNARNVAKAGWFYARVITSEKTGYYLRNVRIAKK